MTATGFGHLNEELELANRAFDQVALRQSKDAVRHLYQAAERAEKLQEAIDEAEEELRSANSVPTTPISEGIRKLIAEREQIRAELSASRRAMEQAEEVVDVAKGALVSLTTDEHPWYGPGEPDGQPGYHCPRCKALNELEMWRRTHG